VDCQSKNCGGNSTCQVANCVDSIENGLETDRDCGGLDCEPCAQGARCATNEDCEGSLVCVSDLCVPTTCTNGDLDATETDVDCGGTECPPCAADATCVDATDCASLVCVSDTCVAASCNDEVQNQDETDLDCGGSCPPCQEVMCDGCPDPRARCLEGSDCVSLVCNQQRCAPASCADGVKNGPETDVNCGGGCPSCGTGRECNTDADCRSDSCIEGVCE
jgi:hypothetical protein